MSNPTISGLFLRSGKKAARKMDEGAYAFGKKVGNVVTTRAQKIKDAGQNVGEAAILEVLEKHLTPEAFKKGVTVDGGRKRRRTKKKTKRKKTKKRVKGKRKGTRRKSRGRKNRGRKSRGRRR